MAHLSLIGVDSAIVTHEGSKCEAVALWASSNRAISEAGVATRVRALAFE